MLTNIVTMVTEYAFDVKVLPPGSPIPLRCAYLFVTFGRIRCGRVRSASGVPDVGIPTVGWAMDAFFDEGGN